MLDESFLLRKRRKRISSRARHSIPQHTVNVSPSECTQDSIAHRIKLQFHETHANNRRSVENPFTITKEAAMAKYLIRANYTLSGTKGLMEKGGTARRVAVEQMLTDLGGKMESFHFAFGETDVFIIADLPDAKSAAAISVTVNAAGGAQVTTTPLMTPEEMDEACKKSVRYRAPGA